MRLRHFLLFLVLSLVAVGVACLPDLAPFTVTKPTDIDSGGATFTGCGDGVIETLDDGGDAGESCDPGRSDAGLGTDVPGCASCQVTCDGGVVDPRTNHCYWVAGTDTDVTEAHGRCGRVGGHLVTFASAREAAVVDALHDIDGSDGRWVGLAREKDAYGSDHREEPGYPIPPVGPCSGCFGIGIQDGGDASGTFPLENDASTTADCIVSQNGTWLRASCRGEPDAAAPSRTTICEREPVGLRIAPCIGILCLNVPFTAGRKTYVLFPQARGPDEAAQSCTGIGGSLVLLDSAEEREELAHEIGQQFADSRSPAQTELQVWAGVTNNAGTWSWDDGTSLDDADSGRPLPWGNGQPKSAMPGDRAYLRLTVDTYDVQLAYPDNGSKAPRIYLCQRKL